MIESKFLNVFCCINCGGDLKQKQASLICHKCNFKYPIISGIPSIVKENKGKDVQITKDKWEQVYKKEDEKLDLEGELQLSSYIQFLAKYLKIFKKGIYLDLGCGISRTSPFLVKNGVSFLGMDISLEGLKKAKIRLEKDKLNGYFVQASFLDIPIKESSLDSVFWGQALEYVDDTKRAVSEVYRILKPGGVLIATFPPLSVSNVIYQGLKGDIPDLPIIKDIIRWLHINIFKGKYLHHGYGQSLSSKFVEGIIKKAGFQVKKIDYYDTYFPITPIPEILRASVRKILKFKPFWPVAYIEAIKP